MQVFRFLPNSQPKKTADNGVLAQVKARALNDIPYFVQTFLPHLLWGDWCDMHHWLTWKPNERGRKKVTAAPRGHAKTNLAVYAHTIHSIIYGYEPYTVIVGWAKEHANEKIETIRDELLSNERILAVFGKLIKKNAGVEGFTTTTGVRVSGMTVGKAFRGKNKGGVRPTRIVLDDVLTLDSVNTPLQRQKTSHWLFKDVLPASQRGGEYSCNIDVVGTTLHDDDLINSLLRNPMFTKKKFQAVIEWAENKALWEEWRAILNDLSQDEGVAQLKADAFFNDNQEAMLEGSKVLWNTAVTYYDLMKTQATIGNSAFQSEYQNEPFDETKQMLKIQNCNKFKVIFKGEEGFPINELFELNINADYCIKRHDGSFVPSTALRVIMFYDPALGNNENSDYNAIVTVAQDHNNRIYFLDCWAKPVPVSEAITAFYTIAEKWGVNEGWLEEQVAFQLLGNQLRDAQTLFNWKVKIHGVKQFTNKAIRISTLEPYFENGWLEIAEDLPQVAINQVRMFPTADHDDIPDALHGAISKLRRPRGSITQESDTSH